MTSRPLLNVTLVVIDRVAHDLTRLALEKTLEEITPFETLIFSDKLIAETNNNIRRINVISDDRMGAMRILWHIAPKYIQTSHFLHIEWDGWVLDHTLWDDDWLQYDYIGAPWPWHKDRLNVGNGGFSLRSKALHRFLTNNPSEFPLTHPEDDALCRLYRPKLERFFKWAPEEVAAQFSLEHGPMRRTFGFHDCRNWERLLDQSELKHRIRLATNYVRSHPAWVYG